MTIPDRLRLPLFVAFLGTFCFVLSGSPAASQEPTDDSLSTEPVPATDTLNLNALGSDELALLRAAALPGDEIDPWRQGSSSVEQWAIRTTANLSAQEVEFGRIGLETDAALARTDTSGRAYASTVNREAVVERRLRALVVDSFVNGEASALDQLTGSRDRLYIDAPIESATESLTAAQERLGRLVQVNRSIYLDRVTTYDDVAVEHRLQGYVVDEAEELDAAARRASLEHAASIRDRLNKTLEVSGEAPETVLVGGFRVAPEIAEPLQELLAAAASPTPPEPSEGDLDEGGNGPPLDPDGTEEPAPPPEPIIFGGWGYRSTQDQVNLRINHCGYSGYVIFDGPSIGCTPPTARPLHSEHEKGLAIDFTINGEILTSDSDAFRWLQENAATYGFFNLPSEAWHWSTTGH